MPEPRPDLKTHVVARLIRMTGATPTGLAIGLNHADRERAGRFRFAEDRTRFLLGRALLVRLLEDHLAYRSEAAELTYTAQGRPVLANDSTVHFNISHSGDLVAVALSVDAQIGIDVEYMTRDVDLDALAVRIFSDDDLQSFRALPPADSRAAFFQAWTGKEAFLKARGIGLFGGLREVSIFSDGVESRVRTLDDPASDAQAWRLHPLSVPADYMGHVAWNDPGKALDFREVKLEDVS